MTPQEALTVLRMRAMPASKPILDQAFHAEVKRLNLVLQFPPKGTSRTDIIKDIARTSQARDVLLRRLSPGSPTQPQGRVQRSAPSQRPPRPAPPSQQHAPTAIQATVLDYHRRAWTMARPIAARWCVRLGNATTTMWHAASPVVLSIGASAMERIRQHPHVTYGLIFALLLGFMMGRAGQDPEVMVMLPEDQASYENTDISPKALPPIIPPQQSESDESTGLPATAAVPEAAKDASEPPAKQDPALRNPKTPEKGQTGPGTAPASPPEVRQRPMPPSDSNNRPPPSPQDRNSPTGQQPPLAAADKQESVLEPLCALEFQVRTWPRTDMYWNGEPLGNSASTQWHITSATTGTLELHADNGTVKKYTVRFKCPGVYRISIYLATDQATIQELAPTPTRAPGDTPRLPGIPRWTV